jgi:hypothetical protein
LWQKPTIKAKKKTMKKKQRATKEIEMKEKRR